MERALKIVGTMAQFCHLLRVQIFVYLLVLLLVPTGVWTSQGTFVGLSDAIGSFSLTVITMALFLLAWTIHITARLVLVYGPDRYGIPDITVPPRNAGAWRRFLSSPWLTLTICVFLPIPTMVALWCNTGQVSSIGKVTDLVLGFVVAVGLIVLSANLHDMMEATDGMTTEQMYPRLFIIRPGGGRVTGGRLQVDAHALRLAADSSSAGLFRNGQLRSGHKMALLFLVFFLLVYVAFFVDGVAANFTSSHMPAALFFAYLLITWITWILSGLSFGLDRFHIPTLSAILISSLVFSTLLPKDHEFHVFEAKPDALSPLSPVEVVDAWQKTHPAALTSPIVVIATEGGGIEAAAWTNLVLDKLEDVTGGRLHDAVVLVSSVSGGSTGAYYYLDQFKATKDGQSTFQGKRALENSMASSLSAAGWGFAYPDFVRILPLVSQIVPAQTDRGSVLEKAWQKNSGSSASMREWIGDTSRGLRPAVIFNATGAETGQPVLFGTTVVSKKLPLFEGTNDARLEQQFLFDFFKSDLATSTAARMSASFPYVSPEGRPSKSLLDSYEGLRSPDQVTDEPPRDWWDKKRLHVADGGLFDNSGVVSAIHWIYDLSKDSPTPHRPIILLMITSPYQQKEGGSWSWQHQLVGPLETVLHARTGSQHVRRNLEAQLISDLSNKTVQGKDTEVPDRQSEGKTVDTTRSFPAITAVRFCNITDPRLQTLSWHLTDLQKNALYKTWDDEYAATNAKTHAEVLALKHLLDPSQPYVAPSNVCPERPAVGKK